MCTSEKPRRITEVDFLAEWNGRPPIAEDFPLGRRLSEAPDWRRLNPGIGWCLRCGMPWVCVSPRDVMTSDDGGTFAICVPCWNELGTADARASFYLMLLEQRDYEDPGSVTAEDRAAMVAAIQRDSASS